jgi:hypothetical protein
LSEKGKHPLRDWLVEDMVMECVKKGLAMRPAGKEVRDLLV